MFIIRPVVLAAAHTLRRRINTLTVRYNRTGFGATTTLPLSR